MFFELKEAMPPDHNEIVQFDADDSNDVATWLVPHLDISLVTPVLHSSGVYVCGGAIRSYFDGTDIKDIDLFFRDSATRLEIRRAIRRSGRYECVSSTDNSETYVPVMEGVAAGLKTIQVCKSEGDIRDLLTDFDFTACKFLLEKGQLYASRWARDHAEDKVLVYTGSDRPLDSLMRAFRYATRGYRISNKEVAEILVEIGEEGIPESVQSLVDEMSTSSY